MRKKVLQRVIPTEKKPLKLNKEVRDLLPDLSNQQWNRIETDISFREGFALGMQVVTIEYKQLLDRMSSIK